MFSTTFAVSHIEQIKTYDYKTDKHNIVELFAKGRVACWFPQWRHSCFSRTVQSRAAEIGREEGGGDCRHIRLQRSLSFQLDEAFPGKWYRGIEDENLRAKTQAGSDSFGFAVDKGEGRQASPACKTRQGGMGGGNRTYCGIFNTKAFFSVNGARYKRIRLRPRGNPSPQVYEYKVDILQELENLNYNNHINLFYGDETHLCTAGYVPYGWQFKDEDVFIPSQRSLCISLFGMTSRNNEYHGFQTKGTITSLYVVNFIDEYSHTIVSRQSLCWIMPVSIRASFSNPKSMSGRNVVFYLPPYSPHLNISETLWRIMKGKWIYPQDYASDTALIAAVEQVVNGIGSEYCINHR